MVCKKTTGLWISKKRPIQKNIEENLNCGDCDEESRVASGKKVITAPGLKEGEVERRGFIEFDLRTF